MMSIAVVDDDDRVLARFTSILERYFGAENYVQQDFSNGQEFIDSLAGGLPNIVFMDIEMKLMNGKDAVHKLREKDINESTFVIYVSSHTDQLVSFFSLHPFDFLVKPFSDEDVFAILRKISDRISKDNKTCTLMIDRKEVGIHVSDVIWVQSQGHRLEVKTCTGEKSYYCYGKLNDFYRSLEELSDDFIRIHTSYVVNRKYITKFTQSEVFVKEQAFPISTKYKMEMTMKLHERL